MCVKFGRGREGERALREREPIVCVLPGEKERAERIPSREKKRKNGPKNPSSNFCGVVIHLYGTKNLKLMVKIK